MKRRPASPSIARDVLIHAALVLLLGFAIVFVQKQVRDISARQRTDHQAALVRMQGYDALTLALAQIAHEHLHLPVVAPAEQYVALQRVSKTEEGLRTGALGLLEHGCPAEVTTAMRALCRSVQRTRVLSSELSTSYERAVPVDPERILDLRSACALAISQIALLRERDLDLAGNAAIHSYAVLTRHIVEALLLFLAAILFLAVNIVWRANAQAEVRRLNAELEQKVLDRTAELAASNQELEAFTYAVSHDLRAPLRGINGWTQILAEEHGPRLDAQAHAHLEAIRSQSRQMGALIDALLKLSRLTRCAITRTDADLSAIAKATVDTLRQTEPDRSIQIDIQPKMRISADPVLLRSIMDNLIGNAWKFTARTPNARIEVSLVTRDGIPVCRVRDNGAGFNMTHATNLFKPFHRLHRAEEFPGTGVGLTTVERIVRRHGGKVWVEAREGHGADFYFTLEPAPSPGPGGPQPEESRDNGR